MEYGGGRKIGIETGGGGRVESGMLSKGDWEWGVVG